jgi:phosphoribosyl 1,2-cyclic phosphodiesterase
MDLGLTTPCSGDDEFIIRVLGSGSAGNCTVVRAGGAACLIDVGLSATRICEGAGQMGVALAHPTRRRDPARPAGGGAVVRLEAALLTHTHEDHVRDAALRLLAHNGATLWAHASHLAQLRAMKWFDALYEARRLQRFTTAPWPLTRSTLVRPLRLPHDSEHTFGFVFVHRTSSGRTHKFSYLADLGEFEPALAKEIADSDVLALEFNHDEEMERCSGRSPATITRVLSSHGHLSNRQAAAALAAILRASSRRLPHHLILLHLSRDCNREELALRAAREVLAAHSPSTTILVARQHEPLPPVNLIGSNGSR